jgi:hypothetical protein
MNLLTGGVAMTNSEEKKSSTRKRFARYLCLTEAEHLQLLRDEKRFGKSAQQLLRTAYFQEGGVALLMSEEEKTHLVNQVHRIGHNVNQLARKVNSGFSEGFHSEINSVRAQVTLLVTWLTSKYRKHRLE